MSTVNTLINIRKRLRFVNEQAGGKCKYWQQQPTLNPILKVIYISHTTNLK